MRYGVLLAIAASLWFACTPSTSNEGERPEPVAIRFGEMPSIVVQHGDFMFAADRRGNAIARIDPSTNEVVLQRPLSELVDNRRWTVWDLDAAGDFLWATIPYAKKVFQLDTETLDLVRQVRVDGHVSEVYPVAGELWFATGSGGGGVDIGRIDADSGALLDPLRLGPRNTHIADVVEFDGSVWVITDHARYIDGGGPTPTFEVSAELWQIEPSEGRIVDKLSLGSTFARGAVNPVIGDVEASEDGLWMSRVHERRLVLVDPTDAELLMQFYVAIFENPWEFEVMDEDLWIGELNGPRIAHIDTDTRERRLVTLDSETSALADGFGSVWVPLSGRPPDGGRVVRLDESRLEQ